MNRAVFFVADDFGLNANTNAGIITAHNDGVLNGTSLMMGQPGTAAAITLARQQPNLQIGWHLHLCDSKPVTMPEWPWGRSPSRAGWAIGFSSTARKLMRAEMRAQWEQFCETGLSCAFVNVHHHLHAHPVVYSALLEVLPSNYVGWIRLGTPKFFTPTLSQHLLTSSEWLCWRHRRRRCPFASSDSLWGVDRLYQMQATEIMMVLDQLPHGRHEFMFHPRTVVNDNDLACLIQLRHSHIQTGQC